MYGQGKYSDSVPAAAGFYRSFNLTDEVCFSSLILYWATNDTKYLTEAEKLFDPEPAWGMSWDEKTILNQVIRWAGSSSASLPSYVQGIKRHKLVHFGIPGNGYFTPFCLNSCTHAIYKVH